MTQPSLTTHLRAIRWIAVVLIIVVSGWAAWQSYRNQSSGFAGGIGGSFELVDQNGEVFTDQDLLGKPYLLYFGYTYCPDVCPTALQQMGAAIEMIGERADEIQTVFITIDPQRDTPQSMAQYVRSNGFPTSLIGLTGSQEQIEQVAKAWSVIFRRTEVTQGEDDYLMAHSSIIYFHKANGEFITAFSHQDTPKLIASYLVNQLEDKPCRR